MFEEIEAWFEKHFKPIARDPRYNRLFLEYVSEKQKLAGGTVLDHFFYISFERFLERIAAETPFESLSLEGLKRFQVFIWGKTPQPSPE